MRFVFLLMVSVAGCTLIASPGAAQDGKSYVTKATFDDVRFELGNAVTTRGFAAHSEGNLAKMLERTGADVGATKETYKRAEFITFCSAKFTRMMVEADPASLANCPFQVFAYETLAKPGDVVVGYRGLGTPKSDAAKKAFAEIEAMLDGIVKDAVK